MGNTGIISPVQMGFSFRVKLFIGSQDFKRWFGSVGGKSWFMHCIRETWVHYLSLSTKRNSFALFKFIC